jgi:hypothetical protein
MAGADQVLSSILDPLDRSSERTGREHHGALFSEHEHLLPEATADVTRAYRHLALVYLEVAGEEVACLVHGLA